MSIYKRELARILRGSARLGRFLFFKFSRGRELRQLTLSEILRQSFIPFVADNDVVLKRAKIKFEDRFQIVDFGNGPVWWPKDAEISWLLNVYIETFESGNPHYFERGPVKVCPGDIVLDCGACEGYFAKKVVGIASKIYMFEPARMLVDCLSKTFSKELQKDRVEIVAAFVGKKTGEVRFFEYKENPTISHLVRGEADSGVGYQVPSISIDEFVAQKGLGAIDFIKVDVESGELDLISGAVDTISRFKPKIAITTYHKAQHANQIVDAVLSACFSYKFFLRGIVEFDGIPRPIMAYFWAPENQVSKRD